jgi:signal transduction histidine kinase
MKNKVLQEKALKAGGFIMSKNAEKNKQNSALVNNALEHSELRIDVLKYFTEHDEDPVDLLKHFAGRLRVLLNCDQILYRDLETCRIRENSPKLGDDWQVPDELCAQCRHADVMDEIYADSIIEMSDCTEGYSGVYIHPDCPIKSALSRVIYCDGKPAGGLAIHYVEENHEFTDIERSTLEEFSRLMSLSLSRYVAKKRTAELEKAEGKKMGAIIRRLSDSAEYVFMVNFQTKKQVRIKRDKNAPNSKFVNERQNFETAIEYFAENAVFEKDREYFREMNKLDYIRERLKTEESFSFEYRELADGLPEWHTAQASKLGKNEAILTYSNTNISVLNRLTTEPILADFFAIYEVDLEDDIVNAMRKNTLYYGDKAKHGGVFSKMRKEIAAELDNETAERWLEFTEVENLRKVFLTDEKAKFTYMSKNLGGRWVQATFLLAALKGGVPSRFVLTFATVDKEEENRLQRESIINTFGEALEGLYYVDVHNGTLITFKQFGALGASEPGVIVPFGKSIERWIEKEVYEPFKEVVREVLSYEYMGKRLSKSNSLTVRFRSAMTAEHRYHEMRIAKPDSERKANGVVITIVDCHEEIMSQKQHRAEIKQNLKMIDVLASAYTSIFYIDLNENKILSYRKRDGTEKEFAKYYNAGVTYTEAMKIYEETFVLPADREAFEATGSIENIKKRLAHESSFTESYRYADGKTQRYCQMTFAKVNEDEEEPSEIILGFVESDEEIMTRIAGKELYRDFAAVYLADLTEDHIIAIKSSNHYDEMAHNPKANSFSFQYRRWADVVDPEYREFWLNFSDVNWLRQYMKNESRKEYVYHVSMLDGWYTANFRTIDSDEEGVPKLILITQHELDADRVERLELYKKIEEQNVTLERQQEELEKALDMAESASRAKTAFLNGMSHDIRTPMNAIMGYSQLAEKHAEEPDLVEYYLGKIDQSSSYLLSLINNILDMSRIESGHVELSEEPDSVRDILRSAADLINFDAKKKKLKFVQNIDGVSDRTVMVDRMRLNRILLNILSNAVKYTPDGGSISFFAKEELSSAKPGFADYEIRVSDNGMGMSEEFLKKIFEPFTRVRSSTVSGIQGTGLGMAITKGIVDLFGGSISIESEEGSGTEVTVRLTLKLTEEARQESAATDYDFRGKHILFVEDNEMNREIAVEILEEAGFILDNAENGAVAVEKVIASKPGDYDLILMDIQMPVMNGYEATRRIRALEDKALSGIPIVAMTANAFEEDRTLAFEAGMNEHIPKPIDVNKMKEVLAKILG